MPENILVVNAEGPETRVGVLENGVLAEYYLERKRDRGIVGNIYRGRVTRVLPGMQAAFVDLGPTVEKAAFLYVADVLGQGGEKKLLADSDAADDQSPEGTASRIARSRKAAANRKIEDLLKAGREVVVQIVKDPIGPKGARVTGFISLPGRYGVLMPAVDQLGVSRRIGDDAERKRLRDVINSVKPKGMGFIVRTAASGAPDDEVRDDVDFLRKLWSEIKDREKKMRGPGLLYADLDMVLRTIRDLLRHDTTAIYIDSAEQYERAKKFIGAFLPAYSERVKRYEGRAPIFDHFNIEPALRQAIARHVPLESGGHLVIDQGEALTAIDVNTGSFVGKDDLETTVTENNLEASKAIAAQLRLRNIGGIIVLDFVDMDKQSNRKKVWEMFNKALEKDRSRCNVTKISELGLVEMTRKRTRESLSQILTEPCPVCEGAGRVKSTVTVAYEILRVMRRIGATVEADIIDVECSPGVRDLLLREERDYLDWLEKKFQRKVEIKANGELKPDQYKVAGQISAPTEQPPKKNAGKKRKGSSKRGGRGGKSSSSKKAASSKKKAASSKKKAASSKKKAASSKKKAASSAKKAASSKKKASSSTEASSS
jgi:ribonuclease G